MRKIRTAFPSHTSETNNNNNNSSSSNISTKGINAIPIGEYRIGDTKHYISFSLSTKPHLFHRMMVRFFFGLRWIDYKPIGNE